MSTITKEQAQSVSDLKAGYTLGHADVAILNELARIALASLEAEPYGYVHKAVYEQAGSCGLSSDHEAYRDSSTHVAVYTAPPAPANAEPVAWLWSHRKHPSEVTLVRPEDDERAEGAHWSGWSCQALYAAPPAPVSVPAAMEMDDDFDSAFEHGKAAGWNACRAAMLQGAEPVTTAYKLPFEQWLSQQTGTIDVECGCVMTEVFFHWLRVAYEAGDSPVIPDGWVACSERNPEEAGRYWCYIEEQNDLGKSHYQWNCSWNGDRWWVESENGGRVTHWMPLPAAPQQEA
ncbi:hypothetical protein ABR28_04300 [Enterobacter hormaechei subsp. hoffmannii]|nr:hypothetical protein ABR28_04300 [Enterobacter hormaechei subsp. hoffmannii]